MFFNKKEMVPVKTRKPLSLQVTYSLTASPAFFSTNNTFAASALQHFAFTNPQREKCSLESGTTLIGFSKKSSDLVLVFPAYVKHDPKVWRQITEFADKQQLVIGELRVAKAIDAQKLTKNGQTIYLVNPSALTPCAKLYPKFTQERTNAARSYAGS